jgi:hypothetical protein
MRSIGILHSTNTRSGSRVAPTRTGASAAEAKVDEGTPHHKQQTKGEEQLKMQTTSGEAEEQTTTATLRTQGEKSNSTTNTFEKTIDRHCRRQCEGSVWLHP